MIPLSIPNLCGNEWSYVKECLDTNFVSTAGPFVSKFEDEFARFHKVESAIAVMNGTASIHLALVLSEVGAQDEVIAPNLTFVAPLNAIKYTGADPILIDCELDSLGLDPQKLEVFLENNCELINGACFNKSSKKFIKVLILVHILGHSAKVKEIETICKKYGIKLIEDASESLGSTVDGIPVGTIGDFGCFSFNGNKIITSGGGGMLLCKDPSLSVMAKHLSTTAKTDGLHFVHNKIGYNYRMVNILAAIGLAQFELLPKFLETKSENFNYYLKKIDEIDGLTLHQPIGKESSYWFYTVVVGDSFPVQRDDLMSKLKENGIDSRPIWTLMNELPMFSNSQMTNLENSQYIRKKVVTIPCSTSISKVEIDKVISVLIELGQG